MANDKQAIRLKAVQDALRQAIGALDRAGRDSYAPHAAACLGAAQAHMDHAQRLMARLPGG